MVKVFAVAIVKEFFAFDFRFFLNLWFNVEDVDFGPLDWRFLWLLTVR